MIGLAQPLLTLSLVVALAAGPARAATPPLQQDPHARSAMLWPVLQGGTDAVVRQAGRLDALEAQVASLQALARRDAQQLQELRAELDAGSYQRAILVAVSGAGAASVAVLATLWLLRVRRTREREAWRESELADALAATAQVPLVEPFFSVAAVSPPAKLREEPAADLIATVPLSARVAPEPAPGPATTPRPRRVDSSFEERAQRRNHWDEVLEIPLAHEAPSAFAVSTLHGLLLPELPIEAPAPGASAAWSGRLTESLELPPIEFHFSGLDRLGATASRPHETLDVDLGRLESSLA